MKRHMSRHAKLTVRAAFEYMRELIATGVEFPTAHERTVLKFNLPDSLSKEIVKLYDFNQRAC